MYKYHITSHFFLLTVLFISCFQTTTSAQFYKSSLTLENIQYGLNICQADFNKDGKMDYITGGYAGEKLKIHFQQNTKGVYIGKPFDLEGVIEVQGLAVADFNGDKALDIIVGGRPLLCLFGDGHDGFIQQEKLSSDYCISLIVADFDGNKTEDFAAINDKKISFFWNNGMGKFEETSVLINCVYSNLKKVDLNKDGKMDLVFNCNEKGNEHIGYLENIGHRNFKQNSIVKINTNEIQITDYNNDTWLDIIAVNIDNKTLSVWEGNETMQFENKQNVFIGGHHHSLFVRDVNVDKKMDLILVEYDGSISFVLNKGNQNFVKTPTIAKIPNYLRMVDLLPSADNTILHFIHTGSKIHGVFEVFLPQMAAKFEKPFNIVSNDNALIKIEEELAQYYNLEKVKSDALVFAYNSVIKDIDYQDTYLVAVEGDWLEFDSKGMLLYGAPDITTERYSPFADDAIYTAYYLEEELKKNETFSYSSNIISEFLNAFYPNVKFDLFKSNSHYFDFKGSHLAKEEMHELYVSWESYSDGSDWSFWTTDLFRTNHKDLYAIISSDVVAAQIKSYLNARYAKKFCNSADVFRRTTRNFSTAQKTKNLPFQPDQTMSQTSYGVYIKGHLLSFDMEGNFLGKE